MTEHGCKVCRVVEEHGLARFDEELSMRWHGESGERMGYRRLADWLNTMLLRREMERVGMPTGGGEAASRYERLVDSDDHTTGEVHRLLDRGGVAVDELLDDFVSYSVVRTHLLDCLDEDRTVSSPSNWETTRLEQLQAYATEEAGDAVRSLVNKEQLTAGGTVEPSVSVTLHCSACDAAVPFDEAIAAGAFCDCDN